MLDSGIHIYKARRYEFNRENVSAMKNAMLEEKTQIVINQWGLPYIPIKTIRKAIEGLDVKVISVYHNNPSFNGRIQGVQNELEACSTLMKRLLLSMKKAAYKAATSAGMRYNYRKSDRFAVLSPCYIREFEQFTGLRRHDHLMVQTNPVTIDASGFDYAHERKRKEVVYVGRLDFTQKRVERILETWSLLEPRFPDWKLSIVGTGRDEQRLRQQAADLKLRNASFEGYQQPCGYYERASLLVLTSDFEGFPLVLAECMSFGVVPVVYDSFPAVGDIVKHKKNGMIVRPSDQGFDKNAMAEAMSAIMADDAERNRMAQAAIKTAANYAIDSIYEQWMQTFQELLKK